MRRVTGIIAGIVLAAVAAPPAISRLSAAASASTSAASGSVELDTRYSRCQGEYSRPIASAAERVKAHLSPIVHGEVIRYELPLIGALNFVLHDALGGGVTRSLALDAHGKALSSLLLELEIPEPPGGEQT